MQAVRTKFADLPDCVSRKLQALRALCQRYPVRRLDLFGSAVRGRFDPARSDLDFLADFEPSALRKHPSARFDLQRDLEVLFDRKVDLLTEEGLVNPYLRRQIEFEKHAIYPEPQ